MNAPTIMVSSAVYGYETLLDGIYDLLSSLGYEVWMSHRGTLPVNPDIPSYDNCIEAVRRCDLFLGLITTQYGTTRSSGLSATHAEFKEAIRLDKLRWFLVEDKVRFAQRLLKDLRVDGRSVDRKRCSLRSCKVFSDLGILDMLEDVEGKVTVDGTSRVNWVQEFSLDQEAELFVAAQFGRREELLELLRKRLVDVSYIQDRLAKWKELHV